MIFLMKKKNICEKVACYVQGRWRFTKLACIKDTSYRRYDFGIFPELTAYQLGGNSPLRRAIQYK